jgi:hypothetical protein
MSESDHGREHERMPINVIAEVSGGSAIAGKYQVSDLSKTGAYLMKGIDSGNSPDVGAKVKLKLVWPMDPDTPPLEVDAEVMRVTDDGIGVQFTF